MQGLGEAAAIELSRQEFGTPNETLISGAELSWREVVVDGCGR